MNRSSWEGNHAVTFPISQGTYDDLFMKGEEYMDSKSATMSCISGCVRFTQVAFDDEVFRVMIKIKSEDVESLTQVPNKDKLETKLVPLLKSLLLTGSRYSNDQIKTMMMKECFLNVSEDKVETVNCCLTVTITGPLGH